MTFLAFIFGIIVGVIGLYAWLWWDYHNSVFISSSEIYKD